ncbi:MAG TPA: VIT domain-containing protein, partial [Armatimonadota bacterium]|nr:VIT domain-containing protein [Armatimonadota bacterium]
MRVLLRCVLLLAVCQGVLLAPACGRVLLKPVGQMAVTLRTKSVTARATVEGQVATTALTLVFDNESPRRIEAEFLYELPEEAVPTYFAYWFGEEKVVARVAEKERAAAIYQHITSRMRDPALVEMVDARTLRARIFPVMPNSELKVEIHFTQALPADGAHAAVYTLPLYEENAPALEEVDAAVRVKNPPAVTNNYGLPVTTEEGDAVVTVVGHNYSPPKDLRVRLEWPAAPLRASLYAAPSGGPDGFFALALTPTKAVTAPQVAISGVATYQLETTLPKTLNAHQTAFIYGRYRRSGPATVTLTGTGYRESATVEFGAAAIPNNPATQLWAAKRLTALSADARNRTTVIAMSKRYNIPSTFASWIAIPQEELARYKREKARADAELVAAQLAQLVLQERENSSTARALHARLTALCKLSGDDPRQVMSSYISGRLYEVARAVVTERHAARPNRARKASLKRELERLARYSGESAKRYLASAERNWQWYMNHELNALADAYVAERYRANPDAARLRQLRADMQRLGGTLNQSIDAYVHSAEERYAWRQLGDIRARYARELAKPEPDPKQVEALRDYLIKTYATREGQDHARLRVERLTARFTADGLDAQILALQRDGQPVPAGVPTRALQQRQREQQLAVRMGDPLITVDAPADAQQVLAVLPNGEVKPLRYNAERGRWEARFDVPAYAKSGAYEITILVVLTDGTRKTLTWRYTVDVTPPAG